MPYFVIPLLSLCSFLPSLYNFRAAPICNYFATLYNQEKLPRFQAFKSQVLQIEAGITKRGKITK